MSPAQPCCSPAQWHTHGWGHPGLWSLHQPTTLGGCTTDRAPRNLCEEPGATHPHSPHSVPRWSPARCLGTGNPSLQLEGTLGSSAGAAAILPCADTMAVALLPPAGHQQHWALCSRVLGQPQ